MNKTKKSPNLYIFPANVLFVIGLIDLLRGFLRTYAVRYAADTFAHLNLTAAANDQLTLLGAFGMSNFLTGILYLLISCKAKELSPYVLVIIPISYLAGIIGLRLNGVRGQAAFSGQYFMIAYFAVCLITFGLFLYRKKQL